MQNIGNSHGMVIVSCCFTNHGKQEDTMQDVELDGMLLARGKMQIRKI